MGDVLHWFASGVAAAGGGGIVEGDGSDASSSTCCGTLAAGVGFVDIIDSDIEADISSDVEVAR